MDPYNPQSIPTKGAAKALSQSSPPGKSKTGATQSTATTLGNFVALLTPLKNIVDGDTDRMAELGKLAHESWLQP